MGQDIIELLRAKKRDAYALHEARMNAQMVRVLRTIGFDRTYVRAEGPYLFDEAGDKYLDLLSGYGVFALGRNHPKIIETLKAVLDAQLPNLVQMDCSLLAGMLAERLLDACPSSEIDRAFFANSGAEAVEAAIKFSRAATGRTGLVYCDHAFHGLTYGALSMNGDDIFRNGFGPFVGDCHKVPFNDLEALEEALAHKNKAAFFVEPIQGKGVNIPSDNYLVEAQRLCRKYGTLFVVDEIQTGLGRTGELFAFTHHGLEPDIITLAKALSGGFVPVGAVLTKKAIFNKLFDRMDRSVVHGSTFGKNNLAMAAGLATMDVLEDDGLIANAAKQGDVLRSRLGAFVGKHEFVKEVRGKGLMIGIEFGPPKSLKLKTAWKLLEKANVGLFCQMITIPLFKDHRIICQVAGHGSYVVKLLPPLVISDSDVDWIVDAFDRVIAEAHRVPGAVWDLATTLAGHALSTKAAG